MTTERAHDLWMMYTVRVHKYRGDLGGQEEVRNALHYRTSTLVDCLRRAGGSSRKVCPERLRDNARPQLRSRREAFCQYRGIALPIDVLTSSCRRSWAPILM